MTLTNAMKARVLDAIYGDTPVAPAATLYVALSTTAPNADGTAFTRPSGNAYADVAVANNATKWPAATAADPAVQENGEVVTFPDPTGPWGEVGWWGVAETDGGTIVDYGALTVARTIDVGSEPVSFAAAALKSRLRNPSV